ncbi:MAG: MATE family efflux transporter [Clostridia bacterium]|nr:MATE family efflux transporter [Clostridia bacterium]
MLKIKFDPNSSTLNFISNLCAFFLTYSISFFLSPFIVETLGSEAYGFVSLATNFTNYISLVTVALNSLAGRFVSVSLFNKEYDKANQYYSSVIAANGIITGVLVVPCAVFILFLERFLDVPTALLTDVKILFALIFSSFFISLLTSLFNVAVFVENKLYLTARHNAESAILRLILTLVMFGLFPAHIAFVGATTLVTNVYLILWQYYYKRRFLPTLCFDRHHVDRKKIGELVRAGSWSMLSHVSSLLNNGFNLLLANELVSSAAMGQIAISITLPSIVRSIMGSVSSAFTPNLTRFFAAEQYEEMEKELTRSIQMLSVVMVVPLAGLTAFGEVFFRLWQPTQDARVLWILMILNVASLTFSGSTASIHEIFTVANRLKGQAIAVFISGIVNMTATVLLIKFTDLGVYAVVCVGSLIDVIRNFTFTFPYAAHCIHRKWYVFILQSLRAFASYAVITALFFGVNRFIYSPDSWLSMIVICGTCGVLGIGLNAFMLLSREHRQQFFNKLLKRA